jgi:hypothetical protein
MEEEGEHTQNDMLGIWDQRKNKSIKINIYRGGGGGSARSDRQGGLLHIFPILIIIMINILKCRILKFNTPNNSPDLFKHHSCCIFNVKCREQT